MADKSLISPRLLGIRTFRNDLRALLELGADQLLEIARIANTEYGFSYAEQLRKMTPDLSNSTSVASALRAASYLYDRIHERNVRPEDAIKQLSTLLPPSEQALISGNAAALMKLFELKPMYERGRRIRDRAVSIVPHYADIQGVCDIRAIFDRSSEEILERVPVVLLGLSFHDDSGNALQTTVQLVGDDWTEFQEKIAKIDKEFRRVSQELVKVE